MLVDTFMFYNELDILELRLELLDEYVDRFVLVEAELNHKGGPKELFFKNNRERFAKWLPKITHVIVGTEELPKDADPWKREKYQRECILRGLDGVPLDAIVMVSDVDEIPDLTRVTFENLRGFASSVHMWMFEYSLSYMFIGEPWFGTVITNCENFKTFGPNALRDGRWKFPAFQYSGWHLSSFGDKKTIWNKFQTYAHAVPDAECIKPTPEMWGEWAETGVHTDGKTPLIRRPDDVPLPGSRELLLRLGLLKLPKFAVCSLIIGDEYKKSMRICTKTQEEHAYRHVYKRITDETAYDPSRAHSWSKIPLLQKYLSNYEYLFWLDADVMIMNPERKIDDFIRLLPADKFLLIGHDLNNLNAGIFIIRNCPLAREFLADVWSKTEYLNHPWWEQAAFIELWRSPKYKQGIEVIPHEHITIFNAYDPVIDRKNYWRPGDWAFHLAGLKVSGHDEVMTQIQNIKKISTDPSGQKRIEAYLASR